MTNAERIRALVTEVADAVSNTDRLKVTGSSEQYLESYFLVEALELQLDRLLLEQRTAAAAGAEPAGKT